MKHMQCCNTKHPLKHISDHDEAPKWSPGKLKLMCSIGSDRWCDELLWRRAHRGHGTSFVLQCAWYTALHASHYQTNTNHHCTSNSIRMWILLLLLVKMHSVGSYQHRKTCCCSPWLNTKFSLKLMTDLHKCIIWILSLHRHFLLIIFKNALQLQS